MARSTPLGCVRLRQAGTLPGGKSAIEHRDRLMPEPAQEPPQPRGESARALVVTDDLHARVDTEPSEGRREGLDWRQRMAAGAGRAWCRQVLIEVCVERVRDVAGRVCLRAPSGTGEVETTVDDRPVGVLEVCRQLPRFDECGEHGAHFRRRRVVVTIVSTTSGEATMAIEVFWGSGSPFSWRVLLALEYKRLAYVSHLLQFSKQEQKSHEMLSLNPRGRVPVLKDGDYVCFESLAILYYLDLKYPQPPLFGRTPEEAGTIMRVICEYQAYIEPQVHIIAEAVFSGSVDLGRDAVTAAMHAVASEARTIEGRLSKSEWIVGDACSAVDLVIFPGIQLLKRALERPRAAELSSRFMPVELHYPSLGRWLGRVAALPGYERTYPPHWRA